MSAAVWSIGRSVCVQFGHSVAATRYGQQERNSEKTAISGVFAVVSRESMA
jgi:hypothetical protein